MEEIQERLPTGEPVQACEEDITKKQSEASEPAQAETREEPTEAARTETREAEAGKQGEPPAEQTENEPYIPRRRNRFCFWCYRFIKRTFDILSSALLLILLSWLILLCLLIKWLEDFHNPVYVSERVGKNGKVFRFYKIRTMRVNADTEKEQLIAQGLNEADGPAFKMKDDPRITKVGKLYRKLSLDELLQLFNILNGTMSVVGPRPPLPQEVEQYTPYQMHRLDIKGGLLCLWQIQKNRNAISFDEWVRLDIEYIERQSLWLDLKIIVKGFFMVLFDRSGE